MGIKEMLPNQIFVWMPVIIGGMLTAGLLPIISRPRELARTFAGLRQAGSAGRTAARGDERTVPLGYLLLAFVVSVLGATALFTILVRVLSGHEFPWWYVAPFALIWSLVFSLIDIRAIGTTGFRVQPPYVRQGMIMAMKPKQIDIWFAPWPIALGSSSWVQNFKTAELTGCTPRSLIKAKLIAYPVGMIANLIFMSIFWSIAPIPSAQYPYTTAILPVWANQFCIWISASLSFSGAAKLSEATQAVIGQLFNSWWMAGAAGVFTFVFFFGKPFKRGGLLLLANLSLIVLLPLTLGLNPGLARIGLLAAIWILVGLSLWLILGRGWFEKTAAFLDTDIGRVELSVATTVVLGGVILVMYPQLWVFAASVLISYLPLWVFAASVLIFYASGKLMKGRWSLSLIGMGVGMVMPIPFAISLLIGGLVAKLVKRKTGEQWFGRNRNIIVAGLAVGEGVVIGLLAAIAALRSSLIALPY
jgi:hypothetical protein